MSDTRDGDSRDYNSHNCYDETAWSGAGTTLDTRLRGYFASRASQPPDANQFWQRLAPHLNTQDDPRAARHDAATRRPLGPRAAGAPPLPSRYSRLRRAASGALAIAAVALISLAAFALLHQHGPLRPASGQTIQRGQLVWHQIALPPGVYLYNGEGVAEQSGTGTASQSASAPTPNANLVVAAANGAVAYLCQTPMHGAVRVWRTTDAGTSWSSLPDLPSSVGATGCVVQVDRNDALTVTVELIRASGRSLTETLVYAHLDGTEAWQPLRQAMYAFSSWHGEYFGVIAPSAPGAVAHLYRSTDSMLTWQALGAPLIAENLASAQRMKVNGPVGVAEVWVQPVSGELLAQTYDGVLWRSADYGQTWTSIALPPLPPASELTPEPGVPTSELGTPTDALVVVGQPMASQPFVLCALVLDQSLRVLNVAPLYCSTDSGRTWGRRQRPAVPAKFGKPAQFEVPSVMLADGSLIAWDVQNLYALPGNNPKAPVAHMLGTIPPPPDPNSIPLGLTGVTTNGAVFWQPQDPRTVYVARYTLSAAKAATATPR